MKLISTFHPPSSVLDSLKCTLADENRSEFLVVAKLNRVDIYSLQREGLRHEQGIEIWGRIRTIKSVPIMHATNIWLLVLTDHPDPELVFLLFTTSKSGDSSFSATRYLCLSESSARPAEFCHDVLVDPSGDLAVVSVYTGKLKIITLSGEGDYKKDFDVSILELSLLSVAFIPTDTEFRTLAMLHFDFQQRLQLLARDIQVDDVPQLSPTPSQLLPPLALPGKWFSIEEQAPRLIFVPSAQSGNNECGGGMLILGGRKILLYELASSVVLEQNIRKSHRMEKKKKSKDAEEAASAKQKEREREWKKKKACAMVIWPWSEVTACCPLTQENDKFLIGDKYGKLSVLHVDTIGRTSLTLVALGEASSPMTLTYLTNQVVYLGSHFGDSQLLQISSTPTSGSECQTLPVSRNVPTIKPKDLGMITKSRASDNTEGTIVNGNGSFLIELESFNNLAPIVDGILVDIDNSGQNEIVTCSGGRNTGSLRVIKSGADFREAAILHGISNVDRVWSLREKYSDQETIYIVVSTLQETHVFRLEDNQVTTISSVGGSTRGFLSSRTLAISNIQRQVTPEDGATSSTYIDSSRVVQVVSDGLLLLDYDPSLREYTRIGDLWTLDKISDGSPVGWAGRKIVAADINASQIVIALSRGRIVQLTLNGNEFVKRRVREFVEPQPHNCTAEISAVTCLPIDSTKPYAVNIAVGFWISKIVKILSLTQSASTLTDVCETSELPAAPRSLLLFNFTSESGGRAPHLHPHLLVGLVNGSLATFSWQGQGKARTLGDQKLISIGNLPVTMHTCRIRDRPAVFACGSRTSIIFWEKERLQHSPLMLKDISAAAEFSTAAHPSSVILASPSALVIGTVVNFDKLHIRSIPLGLNSPRHIVHNPSWGIFAVSCTWTTPAQIGQAEVFTSTVQLFSHTSFEKLTEFEADQGEEVTSLHVNSATLSDALTSFLCVGVTSYDDKEREPSRGRLLLFQADGSRAPLVVKASVNVGGCVYAITSMQNMVLAAVNSSVIVYQIEGTEKQVSLTKSTVFNHNYMINTLVSRANRLLVGDVLTSVSLLKIKDTELELIARDYGSLWPTCAELLDDSTIIGGNSDYNLFAFGLQVNELQRILERKGHYYLGDMVNKFLPGALVSRDMPIDTPMVPKQLFLTPAGQIGVVIDIIDDELSLHLIALQRNLSTFYELKTGINHSKYRAPKNNAGRSDMEATSVGFLDGDFLELFLQCMDDEQSLKQIMMGQSEPEKLTSRPDQLQKVLEGLQSLH